MMKKGPTQEESGIILIQDVLARVEMVVVNAPLGANYALADVVEP
jgi:hypothetical protein